VALYKPLMTPTGTASFWIIGTRWIDSYCKSAYAILYGFESKEHCDMKGSLYRSFKEYKIKVGSKEFDKYFANSVLKQEGICDIDQFYKLIKDTDVDFKDAQDWIYT